MYTYTLVYNRYSGVCNGALRSDGLNVPRDEANADWQAFLAWNATQTPPLSLDPIAPFVRKQRPLYAIYADLQALTAAQKTAVWSDLSSGTPKKYLTDAGPNAAAIGALDWAASDSGATGASLTAARMRITAAYCQDNPSYLVHPSFDATINVPGDQLAS